MGLVVVRCPACRGAARADAAALGVAVACPRCANSFVAVEEAELLVPGPGWSPPPPAPPPAPFAPRPRGPLAPPPEPGDPDYDPDEDSHDRGESEPQPGDADYDPHREPQAGLPASVLIGLALLPFLIPILWLIVPALGAEPPAMTIAAPLALALSASVLCLAVISTIDWTPGTRIKGVLTLVALSYLTGVGLYFVDKDVVARIQRFFGVQIPWTDVRPVGAGYMVKMPATPRGVPGTPLVMVPIACHEVRHSEGLRSVRFVVGSSNAPPFIVAPRPAAPLPPVGTDPWFDAAKADLLLVAQAKAEVRFERVAYQNLVGRELVFTLADDQTRIVRLFVARGRVYYLAAEGSGIDADDESVKRFFESFEVIDNR